MKTKRRLLFRCLFLLSVMFLCMGSAKRVDAAVVAKIGRHRYHTVAKALYAAKNGDTVKILKDTSFKINTLDKDPIKKKKITINLNHRTLTLKGRLRITKKSRVKIKNGTIRATSSGYFRVERKSKVFMKNCHLITTTNGGVVVTGKSSLTLNNCTGLLNGANISAERNSSLTVNNGSYQIRNYSWFFGGGSTLTFNGPVIKALDGNSSLIVVQPVGNNNSSLTINSGTYTSTETALHIGKNQTCTINGGTFSSRTGSVIEAHGILNVFGGSINGGKPAEDWEVSHGILAFETARINLYKGASISSKSGSAIGYSYNKGAVVNNYGASLTDTVRDES